MFKTIICHRISIQALLGISEDGCLPVKMPLPKLTVIRENCKKGNPAKLNTKAVCYELN